MQANDYCSFCMTRVVKCINELGEPVLVMPRLNPNGPVYRPNVPKVDGMHVVRIGHVPSAEVLRYSLHRCPQ